MQLAGKIGAEGERFVLTNLIEMIEPKEWKDKSQTGPRVAFLAELIKEYCNNASFLSYFPEVIAGLGVDNNKLGEFVSNLLMATKLPLHCQIVSVLALYLSDLKELSEVGEIEL